jgi:hypothetical protein
MRRTRTTPPGWLGLAAAAAVALAVAPGCRPARHPAVPTPAAAPQQVLSSEGSDYTPVLWAAARVRLTPESVVVVLDSGRVLAPGQPMAGLPAARQPVVMSRLRLAPVLAVARRPGEPGADAPGGRPGGTAWVALAEGAPAPIADSLRVGQPRPVAAVRWAVARPAALDPAAAFLVLRVAGEALEVMGRAPDGGVLVAPSPRLRVRVYACSPAALDGRTDAARAAALAAGYTAEC